ncbi:MAG TPA: exonuclease domain-containing protein [Ktedonobacteraceae bacterium]|nr:exonuclease domain-containing protein [Ktedonobacteraceae bacterium]
MASEDNGTVPQRGTLLRRAHELLESLGQPVSEDLLVQHLFGANGNAQLWKLLVRQTLKSSSLFEEMSEPAEVACAEAQWTLTAWRSTQKTLDEVEFVVLDTETTGLRPGPDRVIEVAGVRLRGDEVIASFQHLINPGRRIPPFIAKFTGITQEMVNEAPSAAEIFPELQRFIDGAILVGHNLGFDIGFLSHEARLLGQGFPLDGLDTIPLARRFLPGLKRFRLDVVAEHLKIPTMNRHRAMGDARVTAAIFLRLLERAQQQGIATLGHLRRRLQLPVAWSGDIAQEMLSTQRGLWRADGKLAPSSAVASRPTGSLLLNSAWKQNFPAKPGVYLMKDEHGQVIYVGKAKCLKDRLASYYNQPLGYTRKMDGLLQNVREIETRVLGSELEALLVESQLIKALQPAYNVQLRNYELYPFIKVDVQHLFPRVYATREVAADGARYFGPFRSRRMVDLTIELIQKIFPIRTCTRGLPPQAKPSDPCLRLHLHRCSAPCRGGADPEQYRKVIAEVCAFLGGEREDLLDRLRRQMFEASQQLNFERAAWLRDAIHSLDEVLIGQQLITGAVEANNLLIVYPSAQEDHNEIFLIRHGRLVQQRSIPHELRAVQQTVRDLLALAATLGEPPSIVGKAEVDQINIISRWIHRHSHDRAFFPFQHALMDEREAQNLIERLWNDINVVRAVSLEEDNQEQGEEDREHVLG